jgi:hypothetical protein
MHGTITQCNAMHKCSTKVTVSGVRGVTSHMILNFCEQKHHNNVTQLSHTAPTSTTDPFLLKCVNQLKQRESCIQQENPKNA